MTTALAATTPSRVIPADWRELQATAALVYWPETRARFRELGLPPDFFEHDGCRAVAAWALAGCREPMPGPVFDALTAKSATEMPLSLALEMFRQGREDWALKDVDRHAAHFAARWLPKYLRYWADHMEHRGAALVDAARQIDGLLSLVRPLVLAAAAREAA